MWFRVRFPRTVERSGTGTGNCQRGKMVSLETCFFLIDIGIVSLVDWCSQQREDEADARPTSRLAEGHSGCVHRAKVEGYECEL